MTHDKSISERQHQGGQFDPTLGVRQFNVPTGQRPPQARTQQYNTFVNQSNNEEHIPTRQNENDGISSGTPPTEFPITGQPPVSQQIFMEDILRQNLGKFVAISVTFNNVMQEFRGDITVVGTNVVTIEDKRLGSRVILPTLFINYVEVPLFQLPEE